MDTASKDSRLLAYLMLWISELEAEKERKGRVSYLIEFSKFNIFAPFFPILIGEVDKVFENC